MTDDQVPRHTSSTSRPQHAASFLARFRTPRSLRLSRMNAPASVRSRLPPARAPPPPAFRQSPRCQILASGVSLPRLPHRDKRRESAAERREPRGARGVVEWHVRQLQLHAYRCLRVSGGCWESERQGQGSSGWKDGKRRGFALSSARVKEPYSVVQLRF